MKKILILCVLIILTGCTQNYDGGDWYKGDVDINSAKNGYGVYYFSNGDHYEGNWVNNNREGYGKMFWVDGTRYEGNWVNDQIQGNGIFYKSDGDHFEGNFVNGNLEGQGIYYFSDGRRYEGNFDNGTFNGNGTTYVDGFRLVGTYVNGYIYDGFEYNPAGEIVAVIKECKMYNEKLQPLMIDGHQADICGSQGLTNDLNNSNVQGNNLNDFLDIVLGQGVRWGMTEDDILRKYGLNNKNAEIGFPSDMNYLDTKNFDRVRFVKGNVVVELWFFYYDNNYRLYSYELKYPYNENSYENAKKFLIENFGSSTRMTVHNCLTCKEGYEYKKSGTSAYLKKDLGNNFLGGKENIENYIIEYVSDEIANKIK